MESLEGRQLLEPFRNKTMQHRPLHLNARHDDAWRGDAVCFCGRTVRRDEPFGAAAEPQGGEKAPCWTASEMRQIACEGREERQAGAEALLEAAGNAAEEFRESHPELAAGADEARESLREAADGLRENLEQRAREIGGAAGSADIRNRRCAGHDSRNAE